jgi:hypothetical protein
MFVHDFVHVDRPPREVKAEVLANHGRWLEPLASMRDQELHMRVGPAGVPAMHPLLGRDVVVTLGEPCEVRGAVVAPIRWAATRGRRLFPALDAELEIRALGPARTRISLSGRYDVPLGRVGEALDDLVLHGLAEDTLRQFLRRLARALEAGGAG